MAASDVPLLYCNPLPLPDYPQGRYSREKQEFGWRHETREDFRELADPSVLYHDGKWYLYPSGAMVYVTRDFATWDFHPMEPLDIGYAPTVVEADGVFYLTACQAGLYRATSPLGPFEYIGDILDQNGEKYEWPDPMLFYEDGRFYAYWGLGAPGIRGVEMDPAQPNQMLTKPELLFSFDPEHEWERYGDNNEDTSKSFIEGAWMLKHNGRYFLTYAGPGTEWSTYAMGTYVGDSPLGPFTYQARNPILRTTDGLVRGPGHGSLVVGPNNTLWAFYTCCHCYHHAFERRLGMDPAGIDANGHLFVAGATQTPQLAPGAKADPENGNAAGLVAITEHKRTRASSHAPGRNAIYAVDPSTLTWWQPEASEPGAPAWLEINFQGTYTISALRLIWAEIGLVYDEGITPEPVAYRLEYQDKEKAWQPLLDETANQVDRLIAFHQFPTVTATQVRLHFVQPKSGYQLGVSALTVFGQSA